MLENGILVAGQSMILQPKRSHAILHFGPYWTRPMVRETRSDQSAGHVSPLSDFCKNVNQRINHAEERPIFLPVPG